MPLSNISVGNCVPGSAQTDKQKKPHKPQTFVPLPLVSLDTEVGFFFQLLPTVIAASFLQTLCLAKKRQSVFVFQSHSVFKKIHIYKSTNGVDSNVGHGFHDGLMLC